MGLADSLFLPALRADSGEIAVPGPGENFWYTEPGGPGGAVSADQALRVSAVFACVRVLAESIASLPLITYRRGDGESKERARDHWLYPLLHDRPNRWQTAFQYFETVMAHLTLRGVHVSLKTRGRQPGSVAELVPLHPDRLTIKQRADLSLEFRYRTEAGAEQTFGQSDVLWIPFLSTDAVHPISPVQAMARAVNLARAAEDHGERFFANDASASLAILGKKFKTDEARREFRRELIERQTGQNRHMPIVLEGEGEIKELSISHEDAQFLETRKFQVTDIARIFRVPPHLIADLERATFSNIEHMGIEFVTLTLMPWFRRIEQAIARDLIDVPDIYCEFLPDALLRGDTVGRYSANASAIQAGWKTRNEVRRQENLNPIEGLDEPLEPQNMRRATDAPGPAGRAKPGSGGSGDPAAQADPAPPAAAPPSPLSAGEGAGARSARAAAIVRHQVRRAVAMEIEALGRIARKPGMDAAAWAAAVDEFYPHHAALLADKLALGADRAALYCETRRQLALTFGVKALESLPLAAERDLTQLIEEDDDAPLSHDVA